MGRFCTNVIYLVLSLFLSTLSTSYQTPFLPEPEFIPNTPLFTLHRSLISIPSISGNESAVGNYLVNYLSALNLTVEQQLVPALFPSSKPRHNILAYHGPSRKTRVLLTSHVDTVPPYYPYRISNGNEIWGRGSVDAKGSIAAQIITFSDLQISSQLKSGDLSLLFVVDEEIGGNGMHHFNAQNLTYETVIFGEPTEGKLACGHKGAVVMHISAKGKGGHSGYPWLGENAISMLLHALLALERMELPSSKKYGNSTVNIGRMEGGVAANVIAETASAELQIRIAGGRIEEIKETILKTVKGVDERLEVEFSGGYGPVGCDCAIEGFETITVNYGTDIHYLHGTHKRYLYGPGDILVAHSDHEHILARDLENAVEGYKRIVLHALGSA